MTKLSVVITARNDNYGGNFRHRMQNFVTTFLEQAERFGLDHELVVVEWNPPAGPRLRDALEWPASQADRVRFVEVPAELHRRRPNAERIGLFEYIGKNAGIRRARGDFVLVTNPDILMSDELVRFLAREPLDRRAFYRIDRVDVDAEIPLYLPTTEKLRLCREHAVRVRSAYGTLPLRVAARQNRQTYRDYARKLRPREAYRWFMMKFVFRLHTGAPGDFTLLARDEWHRLRGYPELPTQRHIDTYLCAIAQSAGLRQVVLAQPLAIYHQDHQTGEMAARPQTDYDEFWRATTGMLRACAPTIVNDAAGWGLGTELLPEAGAGARQAHEAAAAPR